MYGLTSVAYFLVSKLSSSDLPAGDSPNVLLIGWMYEILTDGKSTGDVGQKYCKCPRFQQDRQRVKESFSNLLGKMIVS